MTLNLRAAITGVLLLGVLGGRGAKAADAPQPDYAVIQLHIEVNRPAEQVWKRVGDFCAIADWMKVKCRYSSGSGDVGTVRMLNDTTLEPMLAKTAWSYTYGQTAGSMANRYYHGTLAIEPEGAGKSILKYTLLYDQSTVAGDAARSSERDRLASRFQGALETMKTLAEAQP